MLRILQMYFDKENILIVLDRILSIGKNSTALCHYKGRIIPSNTINFEIS